MSFGRKGAVPGTASAPETGFGRKTPVDGTTDAMAARRAAFLAEERARAATQPAPDAHPVAAHRDSAQPVMTRVANVSEKSTSIAYLLWFFFGGVGAHRFYLGFTASGICQLVFAPVGYVLLFNKEPLGIFIVLGAGLWILADAFMIPGMVRKANSRARHEALGPVFA